MPACWLVDSSERQLCRFEHNCDNHRKVGLQELAIFVEKKVIFMVPSIILIPNFIVT